MRTRSARCLLLGCLSLLLSCGAWPDADHTDKPSHRDRDGRKKKDPDRGDKECPPVGKDCLSGQLSYHDRCQEAGAWKGDAAAVCAARGMELSNVTPGEACRRGGYSSTRFTCCPGKRPGPEPDCFSGKVTSERCRDAGAWKEETARLCESKGAALAKLALLEACHEGGYRGAEYACCRHMMPPPPRCFTGRLGGDMVCKEAGWFKEEAHKLCQSKDASLTDLSFGRACADGSYSHAEYQCCVSDKG
jgi:hypothetical protein